MESQSLARPDGVNLPRPDHPDTQNPSVAEARKKERFYFASQRQLIWWRFRRHRLAMMALPILIALYALALLCEFIAPYTTTRDFRSYTYAPPQSIHWLASDRDHLTLVGPYVFALDSSFDPKTFRMVYRENTKIRYPIRLFVHGDSYKLWGLIRTDLHLFGAEGAPVLLFGTDRLGRDIFSRIVYGARISLTIGLVGVFVSFILGLMLGGISGFFGGWVDNVVQRTIDLLMSLPSAPLWMTLAAALPRNWSSLQTYFAITVILSIIGWTGLARVVRGKLLALREEDFAIAAKVAGASDWRIIWKHLLPLFFSHIVVSLTMGIPRMILSETAMSFIGLGLQPPAVSWGTLLQDAQQISSVASFPWLLLPCVFVIVTVLMFNFVGDGLRDAADPYALG